MARAPQWPSGSATPPMAMGDGRWTDGEKASGVGDWDAGERRRERGHAAWPRSVAELGCYTRVFHVNKILQCKSL
jgi:hypothetical protein